MGTPLPTALLCTSEPASVFDWPFQHRWDYTAALTGLLPACQSVAKYACLETWMLVIAKLHCMALGITQSLPACSRDCADCDATTSCCKLHAVAHCCEVSLVCYAAEVGLPSRTLCACQVNTSSNLAQTQADANLSMQFKATLTATWWAHACDSFSH